MSTAANQQPARQGGNGNSQGGEVALVTALQSARQKFLELAGGDLGPFLRENEFAMMRLRENTFLADIARKNPNSLRDALIQAAVTGLSLAPVSGHAYLVPRDGRVCFDPSYRGLRDTAVADEIVRWVRADVVFEGDEFSFEELPNGDRVITHQFDAFATDRGKIRGGYCAWEDSSGHRDFITETLDELHSSHRSRSVAWTKGGGGIWKTDPLETIRKSLIKRAHKSWPRKPGSTGRFDAALASAIQADDAVDVTERADAELVRTLVERAGQHLAKWCEFYRVSSLEELTPEQAANMQKHMDLQAEKKARGEARQQPAVEGGAKKPAAVVGEGEPREMAHHDQRETEVDDLWREIEDGLALLADGDLGRADAICAEIRGELGLPTGDLEPGQVRKLRDAVKSRS